MTRRILVAVSCVTLVSGAFPATSTGNAGMAAPKVIWAHVDLVNNRELLEASGAVVVLPKGGDITKGVGYVLTCGERKVVSYTSPPDQITPIDDPKCFEKDPNGESAIDRFLKGGIIIVPRVIHPTSHTLKSDDFSALEEFANTRFDKTPTSDLQVFAAGTDKSLTLGEIKTQFKNSVSVQVIKAPSVKTSL